MDNLIIFTLGLIPLLYFSWKDIKNNEIENIPIFIFFLLGVVLTLTFPNPIKTIILILFMFGLTYYLWKKKSLGGADVKLLTALVPFLTINSKNIFVAFWFYLVIFLFCSMIYGLASRQLIKKKKYIPFVPLITISYLCFWAFRIFIL